MTATPYLATFINYENQLSNLVTRSLYLERVSHVLSFLGAPHKDLKGIHIAGSKGKGSTAAFTAHILCAAGYRVGLYTSPHLYDVRERIRILHPNLIHGSLRRREIFADCISKKKLFHLLKTVRPILERNRRHPHYGDLTYFEVLTILALCYFKQEGVDFVVLETGLGGRLDATNVCEAIVSAITPISLEHTGILGKNLANIAFEKAGIIKSSTKYVVVAPQKSEALKVIQKRCHRLNIRPMIMRHSVFKQGQDVAANRRVQKFKIDDMVLSSALLGRHQRDNAAVAYAIVKCLRQEGFSIGQTSIKKGMAATFWPLRFEIISRKPIIILDGAHNAESCRQLVAGVKELFAQQENLKNTVVIFGCSQDKDVVKMVPYVRHLGRTIIVASAKHPRALIWDEANISKVFGLKTTVVRAASVKDACNQALRIAGIKGRIVITGSLFLAAQARDIWERTS